MINEKYTTRFVAIIILLSIILSFFFILIHLNHECTNTDNCPYCTLINKIKSDLEGYSPSLKSILIAVIIIFSKVIINYFNKKGDRKKYTLVGLKVELIN